MNICIVGDNIISSLGMTTEENICAIRQGISGVRQYNDYLGVTEPYAASVVNDLLLASYCNTLHISSEKFTRFERMLMVSIALASEGNRSLLASKRTLFVFSTTKGNVELLDNEPLQEKFGREALFLWHSAKKMAAFYGNPNEPVVVSNACISGVAAQIVAKRFLTTDLYDTAVVVGGDVLSKFVVSGFQSFKAISTSRCKPFDAERCGLNIGEGAGTIIYKKIEAGDDKQYVKLEAGAITNDANHISGPSRTGEGLYLALNQILQNGSHKAIRFINAHGTATLYNDEMEALAISRAGCLSIPVFSLKAYIGHTLGASGVIETVVSAHALQEGFIPHSLGYEQLGVSLKVNIVTQQETIIPRGECIKTVSGFGGCNAAIRLKL
jgi:3-oxoacyl-(acyl-carrier-protein) synthase